MIETSDLIPLVAPLVTFASVIFSVGVYLNQNDEIGKGSYNAAVLFAALTIVLGLAFVVFISIPENLIHTQSLKFLIGFAALTGLLATFSIGFGITDNPGYMRYAGVTVFILGIIINFTQPFSTTADYVRTLAGIGITTGGFIVTILGVLLFVLGIILTGND